MLNSATLSIRCCSSFSSSRTLAGIASQQVTQLIEFDRCLRHHLLADDSLELFDGFQQLAVGLVGWILLLRWNRSWHCACGLHEALVDGVLQNQSVRIIRIAADRFFGELPGVLGVARAVVCRPSCTRVLAPRFKTRRASFNPSLPKVGNV